MCSTDETNAAGTRVTGATKSLRVVSPARPSFVRSGVRRDVVDRPCHRLPGSRRGDDGRAPRRRARGMVRATDVAHHRVPAVAGAGRGPATVVDADRPRRRPVRRPRAVARAPRPAVRRRPQRRRGPRPGGVHPPRPQRAPHRATPRGRRPTCVRSCSTWRATRTAVGSCRCATASRSADVGAGRRGRDRPSARTSARCSRRCASSRPASARASCCATTTSSARTRSPTTLGISRNSVKTHLQRGLAALEERLATAVRVVIALEDRLRDALHDGGAARRGEPRPVRPGRAEHRRRPSTAACNTRALGRRRGVRRRRGRAIAGRVIDRREGGLLMDWWILEVHHDARARGDRLLAGAVDQAVRAELRRRRVPGQPADRQELHHAHRHRVLPDLLRLHPVHASRTRRATPGRTRSTPTQLQFETARDRRDPADHRGPPRRQPAGPAGDGPPADAEPPARRVDAAGDHRD